MELVPDKYLQLWLVTTSMYYALGLKPFMRITISLEKRRNTTPREQGNKAMLQAKRSKNTYKPISHSYLDELEKVRNGNEA